MLFGLIDLHPAALDQTPHANIHAELSHGVAQQSFICNGCNIYWCLSIGRRRSTVQLRSGHARPTLIFRRPLGILTDVPTMFFRSVDGLPGIFLGCLGTFVHGPLPRCCPRVPPRWGANWSSDVFWPISHSLVFRLCWRTLVFGLIACQCWVGGFLFAALASRSASRNSLCVSWMTGGLTHQVQSEYVHSPLLDGLFLLFFPRLFLFLFLFEGVVFMRDVAWLLQL